MNRTWPIIAAIVIGGTIAIWAWNHHELAIHERTLCIKAIMSPYSSDSNWPNEPAAVNQVNTGIAMCEKDMTFWQWDIPKLLTSKQ